MRITKPSLFFKPDRPLPWGVRLRQEGKYVAKSFATKKERDAYANSLSGDLNTEGRALTPNERSWIKVIRLGAEGSGIPESGISGWLLSLIQERRADPEASKPCGKNLEDAQVEWMEEMRKRNLRTATLESYRKNCAWLLEDTQVTDVGMITRKMLIEWITKRYQAETSRQSLKNHVVPFLSWCAEKGWIARDVFTRLKWPRVHQDEKATVWATPDLIYRILWCADEEIRTVLVLGAFAGLRPTECLRITWADIDFTTKRISLPGSATKKRRPRLLYNMPEVIWLWLERTPKEDREGKIWPKGMRAWTRHFNVAKKKGFILKWPSDALRKGFATHAAVLKGRDWTVNIMGHVDERLLDAVYRGAVAEETAKEYFDLTPEKVLQGPAPTPPAQPSPRPKAVGRPSSKTSRPKETAKPPSVP